MSAPASDPGHLLPDGDWAAVVQAAALEAERIAQGQRAAEAPVQLIGAERYATGALAVAGQVTAPNNGGRRPRGAPTFGVLHDAETPLEPGYAAAMARFFRDRASTSCHYMVDPAETWGVLDDLLVAWHCGNGNRNSLAVEQAGYARFTRAQWTTAAGLAQMDRVAAVMRAARDRYGIGLYWMTDQQLLDAHAGRIVGGWATHDQCRRVLGGTSHTDPMPNYPTDLLMAKATGDSTPSPAPLPAPGSLTGGMDTMRLAKAVGTAGPVYMITDLEASATNSIQLVEAQARAHAVPLVDMHQQQLDLLVADRRRRAGALGLAPRITAAAPLEAVDYDSAEYQEGLARVLELSAQLAAAQGIPA